MIPNFTFIFNQYGALGAFDDHEVRLHHLLQQDALPKLREGKHLFTICEEVVK